MNSYSVLSSPAGPLTIVVDDDGAVVASGFTSSPADLALFVDVAALRQVGDVGLAGKAAQSYLDGDVHAIDDVVVRQRSGGAFLTHAWDVLRTVPAGAPVTYREFAVLSGRPPAIRAAAQACARNAAALFVPCHRVLRTDGTLGGFRWGLPVKRWLLDHEASVA
ncbi:methylated-DNA--[protein]-cysteine S-methyltransferase [Dactylosporangium sp. NPDC000521]|uniref:methylated-DNA--[protein]-cysteine S-methyltransferase n=1 Tax=Dactylosporangium sp. NPDC000521 TaxID=3363975 RepID=UPI0036ACC527